MPSLQFYLFVSVLLCMSIKSQFVSNCCNVSLNCSQFASPINRMNDVDWTKMRYQNTSNSSKTMNRLKDIDWVRRIVSNVTHSKLRARRSSPQLQLEELGKSIQNNQLIPNITEVSCTFCHYDCNVL